MKQKKILIIGDAGRGKTTLAKKLSKKLKIKHYETDDFYFEKKFSILRDKKKSIPMIKQVVAKDEWLIEGTTRHLISPAVTKANEIIFLTYNSLIKQILVLTLRGIKRRDNLYHLFQMLVYQVEKKYHIGRCKHKKNLNDIISKYNKKVIKLTNFKEIDEYLNKL